MILERTRGKYVPKSYLIWITLHSLLRHIVIHIYIYIRVRIWWTFVINPLFVLQRNKLRKECFEKKNIPSISFLQVTSIRLSDKLNHMPFSFISRIPLALVIFISMETCDSTSNKKRSVLIRVASLCGPVIYEISRNYLFVSAQCFFKKVGRYEVIREWHLCYARVG